MVVHTGRSALVRVSGSLARHLRSTNEHAVRWNQRRLCSEQQRGVEAEQEQTAQHEESTGRGEKTETKSMKERIADVALQHVSSCGWNQKALERATLDLGISAAAAGIFPRGPVELVEYFVDRCNRQLAEDLQAQIPESAEPAEHSDNTENEEQAAFPPPPGSSHNDETVQREKLVLVIQKRIMMIEPYRAVWPEALALQALPQNGLVAFKQTAELADELCVYADKLRADRKQDPSELISQWYARRTAVGGIYQAVQLAWLSDSSPGYSRSWGLLRRSVEGAAFASHAVNNLTSNIQRPAEATLQTLQSLIRSIQKSF